MNVQPTLIKTQKDFMDHLENMIHPPKYEEDEYSSRGRLRELKTYILESDEGFSTPLTAGEFSCDVIDTGLENMKILRATTSSGHSYTFFLDVGDERFMVLHTNEKSEDASRVIEALTRDHHHMFDNTWFYSDMLKRLAYKSGNTHKGFGVSYSSKFLMSADDDDYEDLNLNISGSLAEEMRQIADDNPNIKRTIAYNKVRIHRGSNSSQGNSVQDDIYNTGYFAVKRGKSVQDHLQLVDICKREYYETITDVESLGIGVREVRDRTLVEGKPFDFVFPNMIEDLSLFIENMFNSKPPFRLWGLKSIIQNDYFKVTAVDLHTGSPMDFEIANDMMRVYLHSGTCGNTVLRLFTNLQMYYDSGTACQQLS